VPAPQSPTPPGELVDILRAAGCVFAEEEAALLLSEAASADELAAMVEKRVAGHPLEQVLGWASFHGLRIALEPGVFVPRRRSELLVREAAVLAGLVAESRPVVVVDLCCGSGAVGLAVAASLPAVELHAVDIDPAAVRCARGNLQDRGRVYEGDLYAPLPSSLRGRVDVLVANAPYVPTDEIATMPAEARLHEHRVALDGGDDGLEVQRRISAAARDWLAPGAHLVVETSRRQAPVTAGILTADGFATRVVRCAELDATVVLGAARPRHRSTDGEHT
jgi:release factor glutamine methyltransferase